MAHVYELEELAGEPIVVAPVDNGPDRKWFEIGAAVGPLLVLSAVTERSRALAKTFAKGEELLVGYADATGFFTASAVVDRYDPLRRMLRTSNPQTLTLSRRRWAEQVSVSLPIEWCWAGDEAPAVERGTTVDLSARGLSMKSAKTIPEGEEIILAIRLPRHTFLGVGLVVSCEEAGKLIRVSLDQMAPVDRTNLSMYVDFIRPARSGKKAAR